MARRAHARTLEIAEYAKERIHCTRAQAEIPRGGLVVMLGSECRVREPRQFFLWQKQTT